MSNRIPQATSDTPFDPVAFLETAAKGRVIATHQKVAALAPRTSTLKRLDDFLLLYPARVAAVSDFLSAPWGLQRRDGRKSHRRLAIGACQMIRVKEVWSTLLHCHGAPLMAEEHRSTFWAICCHRDILPSPRLLR